MEEAKKENEEQVYDDIEDTEEEKPNRNTELITSRQTAADEESSATTADIYSGPTESTGDKKNILHKLRRKFRPRKSSEDLANHSGSHDQTSESLPAYASIEDDELPATTKRLAFKNMHKTLSFPGFAKGRFTGASQSVRSRSKTFTSGIHGEFDGAKTGEDMFVPDEQAGASCCCPAHSPNSSCLFNAHEVPFAVSGQKSELPYNKEAPPPVPSLSPIARKEQWRRHAKSLSLSLGETSMSDKTAHVNMQKQGKDMDDPSYDYSKYQPTTSATELSLTKSLETLSHYNWYWGPINRYEAEDILKGKPDGCFLVRDSSNEFHLYSVSFRSRGRTCHTRILYENGRFGFLTPAGLMGTKTVVGLIKRSIKISQKGALCYSKGQSFLDTPHPIRFTTPVSRFEDLPSLQHLCRFVIRQNSRCDKLHELPLPPKLIRYLDVENHFLENK